VFLNLMALLSNKNTIIGSGKTLIAVLLLKHVIEKELNDRAEGKPPRISFFLVWRKMNHHMGNMNS